MASVPSECSDLANRLKRGDAQALAELFSQHRERLWRMVSFRMDRRLAGRVDPDDVLQEAYLAAVQRLVHYASGAPASPFAWLRTVVLQTMVDVHRRHKGAQMRDVGREVAVSGYAYPQATSASLALQLAGQMTSPSQAAARAETLAAVEQAIGSMDPLDQEVLALRHFEELTNGEVAEVLGIQPKAASIRYVRAVRRLKEILSQTPGFSEGTDDAGRR
jgi:RNA polymerase sigma-70 factor (ECF subfamily)